MTGSPEQNNPPAGPATAQPPRPSAAAPGAGAPTQPGAGPAGAWPSTGPSGPPHHQASAPTAGPPVATAVAPPHPTSAPSGAAAAPKDIATLPPLPELRNESPTSKRTGEPIRPALAVVALVIFQLAAAGVAFTYGWHWWRAAHPGSYPTSARLIEWVDPAPGKWLALTLEGVLAAVAALVAGACGVAGFQAWNGWRWSRWAGVVALALTGALTTLFTWWGLIPLGLAAVGAALLFMPPMTRYFRAFEVFRATGRAPYRRPERIFYGRLPRYR